MLGKLEVEGGGEVSELTDPNERNLVSEVSITQPRVFGKGNPIKASQHALNAEARATAVGAGTLERFETSNDSLIEERRRIWH